MPKLPAFNQELLKIFNIINKGNNDGWTVNELSIKIPDDLKCLEREEDLRFLDSVLIQRISEITLGDILTEESQLKEEDIDELDHLVKKSLFKRLKAEWGW